MPVGLIVIPIISLEDGLDEDDWESWELIVERLGDRASISWR